MINIPVPALRWFNWLQKPVDNSPLILFRIFFGLLLFLECAGAIFTGWVKQNFILPTFYFSFIGFEWLKPLPGNGMYFYYGLMSLLGLAVMLGFWYRVSLGIFTLLWWVSYLMQKTSYNNHYYFLLLICFLMLLVPANRYASLDVRRQPSLQALTCSRWCLFIFAAQISLVYFFAGIAKIYPDWLNAIPIRIWFNSKANYPVIGPLLQEHWFQVIIAYSGIAFDLLISPFLCWSRTRKAAFIASIFFHLFNSLVFKVGIFPYLSIGLSVFFFSPETIRRIFFKKRIPVSEVQIANSQKVSQLALFYGLIVYFSIQIILPLRHWFIPGDVHWTGEGHRMSWQMMLQSKSGTIYYMVKQKSTGDVKLVYPHEYLTPKQLRVLAVHPDMIWQFAQFLKNKSNNKADVQVYAFTSVSLNGKPNQPLVNSSIDLASIPYQPFKHASWILDFKE